MQTQAGEQSVQSGQEGFPAVGRPQGLTLDGRHPHSHLSRFYFALSSGESMQSQEGAEPSWPGEGKGKN